MAKGKRGGTRGGSNREHQFISGDTKRTYYQQDGEYFVRTDLISAGMTETERYSKELYEEALAEELAAERRRSRARKRA